jgi:hypothetical protein
MTQRIMKLHEGVEIQLHLFLSSKTDEGKLRDVPPCCYNFGGTEIFIHSLNDCMNQEGTDGWKLNKSRVCRKLDPNSSVVNPVL